MFHAATINRMFSSIYCLSDWLLPKTNKNEILEPIKYSQFCAHRKTLSLKIFMPEHI